MQEEGQKARETRSGLAIFLAVALSIFCLTLITPNHGKSLEEFAFGEGTSAYFAHDSLYPIHVSYFDQTVQDSMRLGWELRGRRNVIFLFGNSQSHAINQFEPGQSNYGEIVHDALWPDHDVLIQSVPNANLQEIFLMFRYWEKKYPIDEIAIPLFFDDMREDGIRFNNMTDLENLLLPVESNEARQWNATVTDAQQVSENSDNAALDNTMQEDVEQRLDNFLSAHSESWKSRPAMRGEIMTNLYLLRNYALGINPQSVRRKIPHVYNKNFDALRLIIREATESGIQVLFYIPPLRDDIPPPYDPDEYAAFKKEVTDSIQGHALVRLVDYEHIVGGEYWGMKEGTTIGKDLEYDFMHFSAAGHELLAKALLNDLRPQE